MEPVTDVTAVELATSWPTERWPLNCYAVATASVDSGIVAGSTEYGIYNGPISPDSVFAGRPIARHGWVRLPDNRIWDPTRWVFEAVDPYIYIGSDEDYDQGAGDLREKVLGYSYADESEVMDFLDDPDAYEDEPQFLHKLANTPPNHHPFFMAEVYEKIDAMGHNALIPIDYQKWAGI